MEHLEGRVSVLAALRARRRRCEVLLVAVGAHTEKLADVLTAAADAAVPVKHVPRDQLDAMAHGASHGGVMLVCSARPRGRDADLLELADGLLARNIPPLLLLLEGVDDARNLGFTIRSAEALGAHAVLVKKHLWDFDSTEVARAASGAYETLPLMQIESTDALQQLRRRGLRLYGCLAGVKRSVYRTRLTGPCCLAVGGEKRGLSGAVRKICDRFVTIPAIAGAASLPLAHAAALVLSEAHRQRLAAAEEPAP